MAKSLFNFFSSLKLTVACLVAGCVLVFWGTLAQVHLGLYQAQSEFFRSFFIYWRPVSGLKIPIFPGGYGLGTILLINLLGAHLRFYRPGKHKLGIMLIHLGVVLLLVGQMATDALSRESALHFRIGQTKDYSEAERNYELAVTDTTDTKIHRVVAIPASALGQGGNALGQPELPFSLRGKAYYANSDLSAAAKAGFKQIEGTAGPGDGLWWRDLPRETSMNRVDMPSAIVEIADTTDPRQFLVSTLLDQPQRFACDGRDYEMQLRPERYYMPFTLQLLAFHHDNYPGTDIPKNFSSRVRIHNPQTGEDREVLIFMNNPLRYDGLTFYQASYDPDNGGSVLQVVRNPGWLTPYLGCGLVAAGLLIQFLSHLVPFLKRRLAQ